MEWWGLANFLILEQKKIRKEDLLWKFPLEKKKLLEFKYLLILLETLDCLLFVLKLFFPIDVEKFPSTLFGTRKIPLCNPPNPFSKLRALNGSMPSVLLHFGSSDLTSGSYRTKCELVIRIGQRSQVPCFNKTSLYYVMLQRCYLNTGIQHVCMFWWFI